MNEPDARLAKANRNYQQYTQEASALNRSLALAAIAVCWLFAGGLTDNKDASPQELLDRTQTSGALALALLLAVVALLLDLLQYVLAALAWRLYANSVEQLSDAHNEPSAIAWRTAHGSGLLADFEQALHLAPAQGTGARRTRLRAALRRPDGTLDPAAAAVLDADEAPAYIPLIANSLFWAKTITLTLAYLALVVFLL